jgi:hypothetical protein
MKKRFFVVALVMAFVVVFTAAVMADQTVRIGALNGIVGAATVSGGGQCATFTASPGAIPDNNPAGVCANVAVSGLAGNTTYVSMTVSASHTWTGDLIYTLADPSASILSVMTRPGLAGATGCCGTSADLNPAYPLNFYDAATTDAENVGLGLSGTQVICQANGICDFNPNPDGQPGLADFSGFTGAVNGNWQFCASDGAGGDTGSVSAVDLYVCGQGLPSIVVTKTVGLDANTCATTSNIAAPYNSFVTYCYTMVNTGNVTVTNHTVDDDKLGNLLNNFVFPVGPGNGVYFTVTTQITDSVTNVVTWTVTVNGQSATSANGTATVTGTPTDVALTTFAGNGGSLLVPIASLLVLAGLGALYFVRRRQEA